MSGKVKLSFTRAEEIIPGRMQMIDIKLNELSFSLINIYAPNDGVERVIIIIYLFI